MTCEDLSLAERVWGLGPMTLVPMAIILCMLILSLLAPILSSHDPHSADISNRLEGPSAENLLGTDQLGRDMLSRLLHGGIYTLGIALVAVAIASLIGVTSGLISGYLGGAVDMFIMRLVDIMLAFPGILLALVISGLLGPSPTNLAIALALTGWPAYTRLVRASVLSLRERGYVEAAKSMRASTGHILRRHIFPNARAPILALASIDIAQMIIYAASISFLGLGIQSPTPEWGAMLRSGVAYMSTAPHLTILPGILIALAVLAFNFLGESIRDRLDPREDKLLEGGL